jgi:ABC-type molybdate transport system substrate-binding protein
MKATVLGKLVVLGIVILGIFGAYRLLNKAGVVPTKPGSVVAQAPGTVPMESAPPPTGGAALTVLTSASKEKLLRKLVDAYGAQNGGSIAVKAMESREGLQAILSGTEHPQLYSPSDSPLTESLNTAWKKAHRGAALINTGSPESDLVFAETPCIFLTTETEASKLEPLLTSEKPYAAVLKAPGLTFSIANPLASASGLLALGRVQQEVPGGLKALKTHLLYDAAAQKGSTQLLEAYLSELKVKGSSPRSFIIAYENKAIEAQQANPELKLKLIYPKAASVAEQRISVLEGEGAEQARGFVRFLKTPDAQQLLISEGYHPRFVRDTLPSPSYKTSPPLPYNELMNAADIWNKLP